MPYVYHGEYFESALEPSMLTTPSLLSTREIDTELELTEELSVSSWHSALTAADDLWSMIEDVNYPISQAELVRTAQKQGLDQNWMQVVKSLPETIYDTPLDLDYAISAVLE